MTVARIPWLFRRRIGVVRAYISTLLVILFRPRFFAIEMCRPVAISIEDARLFRKRTAQIAAVSTCLVLLGLVGVMLYTQSRDWPVAAVTTIGVLVAVRCFGTLISDMPTFIWPGAQGSESFELTPLQNYTAALIVLLAIPAVPICVAAYLQTGYFRYFRWSNYELSQGCLIAAAIVSIPVIFFLWRTPVTFMGVATRCSTERKIAMAIYLPLHWFGAMLISAVPAFIVARIVAAILHYELRVNI